LLLLALFVAGFLCGNWSIGVLLITSALIAAIGVSHQLWSDDFGILGMLAVFAAMAVHHMGYFASVLFRSLRPHLHARPSESTGPRSGGAEAPSHLARERSS
jgi:hypothetical protein